MDIYTADTTGRAKQLTLSQVAYRDALQSSVSVRRPALLCCRPPKLSHTERTLILRSNAEAFIVSLFGCIPEIAERVYRRHPVIGALVADEFTPENKSAALEALTIHGTLLAQLNPGLFHYEHGPCTLIPSLNELAIVVDEMIVRIQTNKPQCYGDDTHTRFMIAASNSHQLHHQTTHLTSKQRDVAAQCFMRLKEVGTRIVDRVYRL